MLRVGNIKFVDEDPPSKLSDRDLNVFNIAALLGQTRYRYICALAGKEIGHRTPYAGVSSGDQRAALQRVTPQCHGCGDTTRQDNEPIFLPSLWSGDVEVATWANSLQSRLTQENAGKRREISLFLCIYIL